jgi:hypothetical protein
LEKRSCRKSLRGLTVAALYDVRPMPSFSNGVDHAPGSSLDGNDLFADGALGYGLARFGVSPVDQDRACCAESRPAAELRPTQLKEVPQGPE